MKRVVVLTVAVLTSALVAQGCKKKSSSSSGGGNPTTQQAATDLEAEKRRIEEERARIEADRKTLADERAKFEAEKVANPAPIPSTNNVPGTSTPVTTVHSCTRGPSLFQPAAYCEDYLNLQATQVTQLQTTCTAGGLGGGLGGLVGSTWAAKACDATLNSRPKVGGCRTSDGLRTVWYYAPYTAAEIQQRACPQQGRVFVNP